MKTDVDKPPRGRIGAELLAIFAALGVFASGTAPAAVLDGREPLPCRGFSSENVQCVGTIPEIAAATASVLGRYLYITNERSLYIYDVSDPAAPVKLSELDTDGMLGLGGADPATNGKILLLGQSLTLDAPRAEPGRLSGVAVIDVTDKRRPQEIAFVPTGVNEPVWTCLFGCRWAYGAWSGLILDLRNPATPRLLRENWKRRLEIKPAPGVQLPTGEPLGFPNSHYLDEVRPGLVLTGSVPMYLLDVRDPRRPRAVEASDGSPYSLGGVDWPLQGTTKWVLSFNIGGIFAPRCELREVMEGGTFDFAFATWDTSPWKRGGQVRPKDRYYLKNGRYTDGNPAVVLGPPVLSGCQPGWFDVHPGYRDNGLIGLTSPGHGVKFLEIDDGGRIHEAGFFLPPDGVVYDGQWITDEIFYALDLYRGIDILRFEGEE